MLMDALLLLYGEDEAIGDDAVLAQLHRASRRGWIATERLINGRGLAACRRIDPAGLFAFWHGPMKEMGGRADMRRHARAPLEAQMRWSRRWLAEDDGKRLSGAELAERIRRLVLE